MEWVFVMPKQRTTEEVGVSYNVGDLVSVQYFRVVKDRLKFVWYPGIVTDNTGLKDGTGECRVLTLDGKHDWSPLIDLVLIRRVKPNNIK